MASQRHDVASSCGWCLWGLQRCGEAQESGVARRSLKLGPEQEAKLTGQAENNHAVVMVADWYQLSRGEHGSNKGE
jgi:hypothetical protein